MELISWLSVCQSVSRWACRSVGRSVVVVDIEVPTRKVGRRPSKWYPSLSIEVDGLVGGGKKRGKGESEEETEQF